MPVDRDKAGVGATGTGPALLSGGNPQIAMGHGPAPVAASLAAMPGWKRDAGHRLHALVRVTVPGVANAVKWNRPFYRMEPGVWLTSFRCFTRHVKITFFRGTALEPVPPGASRQPEVRHLDLREGDPIDTGPLSGWIVQASRLPGERL